MRKTWEMYLILHMYIHGLLYTTRTDNTHFAGPQNKDNIKFPLISYYVH